MRIVHTIVCAGLVLACAAQAEAASIYASTASGTPGQLYVIDSATGAMIQNVAPLNDALGTNYPITGLALHPVTGVLYGATANNPLLSAARLVRIDPANGRVTVIGPFNAGPVDPNSGTPSTMGDLAFDAAGNLFGVGTIGGPQLYSINPATGQASVIGNSGLTSTAGGGLAISAAGTAYGTPTAAQFGTYNRTTGAYTNISAPAHPAGGGAYAALDFGPDGVLYGLNSGPGSPPPTHLVSFNPTTGAVTDLGASIPALDAIAVAIPEPGAGFLLVAGGSLSLWRRRRG